MIEAQNEHINNEQAQGLNRFSNTGVMEAPRSQMNPSKPQLNQMAQEFTPHSMAKKQQGHAAMLQQQQLAAAAAQGYGQNGFSVNQQAALQAAMMNPATLQAVLQNQNPSFLHHIQQQQLQQLQQLHQQNLRLAAAFSQNQMGIYNATSALLQQMPGETQGRGGKTVADVTNDDFEHFPTREDVCPSPPMAPQATSRKGTKTQKKDHNKDSAFDDISDDSSDSNGSSYLTMDLEDSEIPDREVLEQICRQVEEYLSDDYLATDKYLLRQLRSKSEGYLSVKLLTSFKKIKKLTRDWRVTAHALKLSAQVELSTDGHRVKRQDPLPDNLRRGRTMTSILAIRVPDDWATLEAITNIFSAYGNITLARVLRPGRAIPPDLRNYATQIPDMGTSTCAVVDFDSTDSAHECCRGLRDKNLRGMRIALLGPRIRRTLYKAEKKKVEYRANQKITEIPENRRQRRINAGIHDPKNVSKEEGLKIIQSYFHNQVKPTPDDPIDFPPLHAGISEARKAAGTPVGQIPFTPFEQMNNQMQELAIQKAPQPPQVTSKWGPAQTKITQPTMSQIVAQNVQNIQPSSDGISVEVSDQSSESGLASPKHALKSFKGWNLTVGQESSESTNQSSVSENDEWCPWGNTAAFVPPSSDDTTDTDSVAHSLAKWTSQEEDDVSNDVSKSKKSSVLSDFTFDPIPSLDIGQGIWSNSNSATSGW